MKLNNTKIALIISCYWSITIVPMYTSLGDIFEVMKETSEKGVVVWNMEWDNVVG